jgi:two-component system alkaline phosphatase synthesis response regulator PhoP
MGAARGERVTKRVLVIEDSPQMGQGLVANLEMEGYDVRWAEDGAGGLVQVRDWEPQLVILDVTLPGLDGFGVLRALREEGLRIPVLILSGLGEEVNKVRGFRLGADDYVTKPFGVMELLARVEALLRRSGEPKMRDGGEGVERFGNVEVNTSTRAVTKRGRVVTLTPRAFDLLVALIRSQGAVLSRLGLLKEVWGYRTAILTRTVDAHVAELRRKLEDDPAAPRHILTVRKVGYRLQV